MRLNPFRKRSSSETDALPTGPAERLLSSGIFDAAYYAAVSDLGDVSAAEAAEHYVTSGVSAKIEPHPLIDFGHFPATVRDAIDRHGIDALLDYLHDQASLDHAWGPLFDPRSPRLEGENPVDVLSDRRDDRLAPVPDDYPGPVPTMGTARAAITGFMATYRHQFIASLPQRRSRWDREGTRAWVSRITSSGPSQVDAKVSVIMPALNREGSIGRAIESVLAQTHANFELLIVDDGSTDGTASVIDSYASQDPRVRVFSGPHQGVGAARNTGLDQADGDFIAFLDSDNTWTRRFLELSLAGLAAAPDAVAVHAGLRLHGDNDRVQFRGGEVQFEDLQLGNSVDINVLVVRADALATVGGFDTSVRRWVDYDLILRLARAGRLEYLPFIGCDYDNRAAGDRITQRETTNWQWAVRERHLVDWEEVRHTATSRVPGRLSLIIEVARSSLPAIRAIDDALTSGLEDLEVVVVDHSARRDIGRRLVGRYATAANVRYARLPGNTTFAVAANYGFAHSTGTQVLFLAADAVPRPGWISALLAVQQHSRALAVQALLVNGDRTVQSAGYAFFEGIDVPSPLFAGLTVDDAVTAGTDALSAVLSAATLIGADDFTALRGFDPLFADGLEDVDLCLRATSEFPERARFACAPDAIVVRDRKHTPHPRRTAENRRVFRGRWKDLSLPDDARRYEALSLRIAHFVPEPPTSELLASPLLVRERVVSLLDGPDALHPLRWAIKTGAPHTRGGDHWGDIAFANDLARALRTRGQQVVIDRHEAEHRGTSYLDDVVLALRGRHAIAPQPRKTNVMWVISRPDLITPDEVRGYDLVFAASEKWAAWMSERAGMPIGVLPQATDPERFRPDLEPVDDPDDVIFVGGSHGHEYGRAMVGLALQAGAPVGLWGPGWHKVAPEEAVRGGYLDFTLTPRAYRSAQIVLNDHFPDMAEWGFVNNRTFDAVACGTPVISDAVEGLEMFRGAVVVADSVERMRELISDRSWRPSDADMAELSLMVRTEHSFAARAATLIDAVLDRRNQNG